MFSDWQPRDFLLYYGSFLLALLLMAFFYRRPRKGMRLRLNSGSNQRRRLTLVRPTRERSLNVMFNYNGHSWDAYEVLGLPAGSTIENVESSYKANLSRIDQASRPFIEAAYQAIISHNKVG